MVGRRVDGRRSVRPGCLRRVDRWRIGDRAVREPLGGIAGTVGRCADALLRGPVPDRSGERDRAQPVHACPHAPTSPGKCAAGHAEVGVTPGDASERHLCVRPGTTVSLVLGPRDDDKRWTGALSSAPVFALVSGWKVAADGTARASVRCAGTRGGTADVTVSAKAPDVAGAPRAAFTLRLKVVPYTTQG